MINNTLTRLRNELINTFAELDGWFNVNDRLLKYHPINGGWSISDILEHISLTNHYLLILIRKGTAKAVQKAKGSNFQDELLGYELNWEVLRKIGEHRSFEWIRPEHMQPKGEFELTEIKSRLNSQLQETLGYLEQMPNGEGVLHKTMMTVNGLGKIDVYHYIYFLAQHIKRHITQMQKIEIEFNDHGN
jgi:hypothetical protein